MDIISKLTSKDEWDDKRFDLIINNFLSHITDEKPITARQCIKALAQIGQEKHEYIPAILTALESADLSKYKDSMRPLTEKDIEQTKQVLTNMNLWGKRNHEKSLF